MMKKYYICPSLNVLEVSICTPLLAGSNNNRTVPVETEGAGKNVEGMSRRKSVWDYDDEEEEY